MQVPQTIADNNSPKINVQSVYVLASSCTNSRGVKSEHLAEQQIEFQLCCLDTLMFYSFAARGRAHICTHIHTILFWLFTGKTRGWCCEKYFTAKKHVCHWQRMANTACYRCEWSSLLLGCWNAVAALTTLSSLHLHSVSPRTSQIDTIIS